MSWEVGRIELSTGKTLDGLRKELLYVGKAGSVININYREYGITETGSALARPAFSMNLTYDISSTGEISFQDVRMTIFEANQHRIVFEITRDPEDIVELQRRGYDTSF